MSDAPPWEQAAAPPTSATPPWEHPPEPDVKPLVDHFKAHEADDLESTLKAGFQSSVFGTIGTGGKPSEVMPKDAGFLQRQEFNIAQMASDLPFMMTGAGVGGTAGTAAGAPAGPFGALAGRVAGAGAGAFMLPTVLRETLMDHYENGSVESFGQLWDRAMPILTKTLKSGVVGAAVSALGAAGKPIAEAVTQPLVKTVGPMVASGAKTFLNIGNNAVALGAVGPLVDGRTPTRKDFEDAAVLAVGFHGATEGSAKLRDIYRQTGIEPATVIQDMKNNPDIEVDLLTKGKTIPDAYKAAVDPEAAPKENTFSADAEKALLDTVVPKPKNIERSISGSVTKMATALKDAYTKLPAFTDIKRIIGEVTGEYQIIDDDVAKQAKNIQSQVPDDRQRAITRYIQAGGDTEKLAAQEADAHPDYKQHYKAAQSLTPEEAKLADHIRSRQDTVFKLANDADVVENYVENYVTGLWEKPNPAGKSLIAQANSGYFRTNPREARGKIFENYFEGEKAGYKPKDDRIGYLWATAERSMRRAIAARKAVASMMSSTEQDGKPTVAVGGGGRIIEGKDADKAYLINPNSLNKDAAAADGRQYQSLDHPALRKWKWTTKDTEGNPIYVQGDMVIHPDAIKRVNALLGKSRVRDWTIAGLPVGDAALKAGAFVKGSVLAAKIPGLPSFHQVNVGEHALWHGVNPLAPPEFDLQGDKLLQEGVKHGLMLVNHDALEAFSEGANAGGIWRHIPVYGDYVAKNAQYVFQDYIPRLKAEMFRKAVGRAEDHYKDQLASGKITRDQMLENAASQSNAAFGEQNYKYIGRSPTVQDMWRIGLLAPDFLESRVKFAGQAMSPYGKEQAMALVRSALVMGAVAQTANVMFGDDHKVNLSRPFSVTIGGKEYSMRSVIGDIQHLMTDPKGFWYYRLNPLWGKPVWSMLTGENSKGQKVGMEQIAAETLKSWVPIPAQGLVKHDATDTFINSVMSGLLQSVGLTNRPHKTDAEKAASDISFGHQSIAGYAPDEQAHHEIIQQLKDDFHSGELPTFNDVQEKAQERGITLTRDQIKQIYAAKEYGHKIPLDVRMKHFTSEEVMQVWGKMSDDEKRQYQDFTIGKITSSKTMSLQQKMQFIKRIRSDATVH